MSAPRDVRRRLDQFVANPDCGANVLSAVHDIPMQTVARSLGVRPTTGQSPFAIARGKAFERALFASAAERLRRALIEAGVLPPSSTGLVDMRLVGEGGQARDMDEARGRFVELLHQFAASDDARRLELPSILAGPALRIPGKSILPEALFAVDVITVHPSPLPGPVVLRIGEIKVYPDRGGYTDPGELSSTRAQAGLYVHAARLVVEAEGLGQQVDVVDDGFLVLSRPGSNQPSVRAGEDLRWQAARAARSFEQLSRASATLVPAEADAPGRLATVIDAPKAYKEGCLALCDLAAHCHRRALAAGDPVVLGMEVARTLGALTLPRAMELLSGGAPRSATEHDFLRRAGFPVSGVELWATSKGGSAP